MKRLLLLLLIVILLLAGCVQISDTVNEETSDASDSESIESMAQTSTASIAEPTQKILFDSEDVEWLKSLWPLERTFSDFGELSAMDLMTFSDYYIMSFEITSSADYDDLAAMLKEYVEGSWKEDQDGMYVFYGVADSIELVQCRLSRETTGNTLEFTISQDTGYDQLINLIEAHWPNQEADWLQEVATTEPESIVLWITTEKNSITYSWGKSDVGHDFDWFVDYFKDYADYAYQPEQGDQSASLSFSMGSTTVTLTNSTVMGQIQVQFLVIPESNVL